MENSFIPQRFDAKRFAQDSITYRYQHRLSRVKLAEAIGATQHMITAYELHRALPSIDIVLNLCELMGKSVNHYHSKG